MKNELSLELPEKKETVFAIIENIPIDWTYVIGVLYATDVISKGMVVESAGIIIDIAGQMNLIGNNVTLEGGKNNPVIIKKEKHLTRRKLPGFVRFDETGYGGNFDIEEIKKLILKCWQIGYRKGGLRFYKTSSDHLRDVAQLSIFFPTGGIKTIKVIIRWVHSGKKNETGDLLNLYRNIKK